MPLEAAGVCTLPRESRLVNLFEVMAALRVRCKWILLYGAAAFSLSVKLAPAIG